MTESGSTDLFSLALKARGEDDVVWVSPEERELGRGLLVSPEKATKGKGGKYIRCVSVFILLACRSWPDSRDRRGRLADNAVRTFANERTATRLWEMQTTTPAPDLTLRVLAITHATASSATLARCAILGATVDLPRKKTKRKTVYIPFGTQEDPHEAEEERWVMFRVDDAKTAVKKVVRVGGEIGVWKPWMTLPIPAGDGREEEEAILCTRYVVRT